MMIVGKCIVNILAVYSDLALNGCRRENGWCRTNDALCGTGANNEKDADHTSPSTYIELHGYESMGPKPSSVLTHAEVYLRLDFV